MPHVLFVHGMFLNGRSWERWEERFRAAGFTTSAPSWPHVDGDPAALRATVPPALSSQTLEDVVAAMAEAARSSGPEVRLVGHSMGGLVVQRLLAMGLGAKGVSVHGAPPAGVLHVSLDFLRSNWKTLVPTSSPIELSDQEFVRGFAHASPPEEARRLTERYLVPTSRLVGRGPTGPAGQVDFAAVKQPLLHLTGDADRVVPADIARKSHAKYEAAGAPSTLRAFPGRGHGTCLEAGWEEVADAVIAFCR